MKKRFVGIILALVMALSFSLVAFGGGGGSGGCNDPPTCVDGPTSIIPCPTIYPHDELIEP